MLDRRGWLPDNEKRIIVGANLLITMKLIAVSLSLLPALPLTFPHSLSVFNTVANWHARKAPTAIKHLPSVTAACESRQYREDKIRVELIGEYSHEKAPCWADTCAWLWS